MYFLLLVVILCVPGVFSWIGDHHCRIFYSLHLRFIWPIHSTVYYIKQIIHFFLD